MSLRKNKNKDIRKNAKYKEEKKKASHRKSVFRWGWRAEGVWMWEGNATC